MADAAEFINEAFYADQVSPAQLDILLAGGWRHFGSYFFRYSFGFQSLEIRRVIPLRIRLADFSLSKSQRRVLRRNEDLKTVIRPIKITKTSASLFQRHKQRFKEGVPDSIYDFLSHTPADRPCDAKELAVYLSGKLAAVSYFDVGGDSTSGIYAMFDPNLSQRSLGIFTLLKEIEYSIARSKTFYYLGYCYDGNSFHDYKKRFTATQYFEWSGRWMDFGHLEC